MPHRIPLAKAATTPETATPDLEPDLLTARELVAEARAAVAKSRELIAVGRKLRAQSELIFQRFRKRRLLKPRKTA